MSLDDLDLLANPDGTPHESESSADTPGSVGRKLRIAGVVTVVLLVVAVVALFAGRAYIGREMRANLPQLDGSLTVYGLAAPVTVARDTQGVPHIRARSIEDLVFAQGYITAQDRLWQMDLLRRHAAGQLAAILGSSLREHDRLQRTLQLREAADRAVAVLPADQKHWLEIYARGVNASMIAQHGHLPVEFRVLGYDPAPWTPRDSLLVELVMYQDLSNGFPDKLGREALATHLSPDLIADLYPTGSWRDHPPGAPVPDVTAPQPDIPDVPLDESQTLLRQQSDRPGIRTVSAADLQALKQTLALFHPVCDACVSGSNGWAVSGSRTVSGKPMLSNDMHLSLSVPELWYEADLMSARPAPLSDFHAAGVTLPGIPFVIAGHNEHVAWGFTNLGADVQDVYIEHTRGTPSGAQYQTAGGDWVPIRYQTEVIHVRGGADDVLNVPLTRHGNVETPIISGVFPGEKRSLSLQWTIYDPASLGVSLLPVNSASDWTTMLAGFSIWGGPPQNMMYADDQGHIGYHAVGHIPVRGDVNNPSPLSGVPLDATASDAAAHKWVGYIPFDQLPQAFDPPDGVLATANGRVTLDGYRFPITLDWMAPYRTERIYKVLEVSPAKIFEASPGEVLEPKPQLTPANMLALQNDVYSELDHVLAQRYAYAIDHANIAPKDAKTLHQAADLLRRWNGKVDANAAAPAIVNATRAAFWPMVLIPKLAPEVAPQIAQGIDLIKIKNLSPETVRIGSLWKVYAWGEKDTVEEKLLTDTPARWLPPGYANWNDFLAAAVLRGLSTQHAPADLSTWQECKAFPLDIEHPIFGVSGFLQRLIAVPTGTGVQAQSGDRTTVKQVGLAFGPSERFTADLSDPNRTTLNLALGQSGNPASPWYMDQFPSWLHGKTYPLPFTPTATQGTITHTLTLNPR